MAPDSAVRQWGSERAPRWSELLERDDRPVCGAEHEYRVRGPAGSVVDFRQLVDGLGLGRRVDPGDPHAHRGPWGGAVTADGDEAEVVTPPVPVERHAAAVLHAWTATGRRFLADRLPPGHTLEGYSTHISTGLADVAVRRAADELVRHASPALMLLLDRRSSPGLLVRPRPGRLEICGEYTHGRALRHAAAVALAASQWAHAVGTSRRRRRGMPPSLEVRAEASRVRYGTYVDRTAFGPDLYAIGRAAVLRTKRGTVRAGEHLATVVEALDDRLGDLLDAEDLAALHAVVAGDLPLPMEQEDAPADDAPRVAVDAMDLRDRRAGAVGIRVMSATWWVYVVRLDGRDATRWLTVPRPWIDAFLSRLDAGALDAALADVVAAARR